MSTFTAAEIEYLRDQPPARLATAGPSGRPQVKPVGFLLDPDTGELVVGGYAGSGMATRINGSSFEVSARDVVAEG